MRSEEQKKVQSKVESKEQSMKNGGGSDGDGDGDGGVSPLHSSLFTLHCKEQNGDGSDGGVSPLHSSLFTLHFLTAIALIDNDCLKASDAIVLLEGDGLNRYQKAVDLYNAGWAKRIIFSGGITDYEYGSFPYSDVLPRILDKGVPREAIIHENKSLNTREQAVEVIGMAVERRWEKLILVATHEHQYRAYLTFLREALDKHPALVLYNAPVRNLKWFSENPWGKRIERLQQELERIEKYTRLGHLATPEEVIQYQQWKEEQP
jgi:uncharacterized SAM-binding protein YcdF (DUF218 family)